MKFHIIYVAKITHNNSPFTKIIIIFVKVDIKYKLKNKAKVKSKLTCKTFVP